MNRKPKNIAGQMGKRASQPAKMNKAASVDPIERLNQRMAGRTEGGNKSKKRKSLMNSYGMA